VLADTVDQAVTNRFQFKNLLFENEAERLAVYNQATGEPYPAYSGRPNLVDGDVCYVATNKKYYIWNGKVGSTKSWISLSKRLQFSTIASRDVDFNSGNLSDGDSCHVSANNTNYTWNGSAWIVDGSSAPAALPLNQFYAPAVIGSTTSQPTPGQIYYTPIHIPIAGTYNQYSCNVTSSVAGTAITIALFTPRDDTGFPNAVITGTVATVGTTSTGNQTANIPTPPVLQPGWYWIACFVRGSATAPTMMTTSHTATAGGHQYMPRITSGTLMPVPEISDGTNTGGTNGVMPSPAGTISYALNGTRSPYVTIRKSA
jgi:hypothetical protein